MVSAQETELKSAIKLRPGFWATLKVRINVMF
jgi:hypothetical protein